MKSKKVLSAKADHNRKQIFAYVFLGAFALSVSLLFRNLFIDTATPKALAANQNNQANGIGCRGPQCKHPKYTPTPTATNSPTQTPTPAMRLTPTVTPVPLTPTPISSGSYCPTHDPRKWHGLFDPGRNCWYDHEHGDNPHAVDSTFGTGYFTKAGGEISYPWQTFMTMTMNGQTVTMLENSMYPNGKHQGYKWFVRKNMLINGACTTQFADWCVSDVRAIVHFVGSELDANSQVHSAYIEARVCPKGQTATNTNCGIVRNGGWINYGNFELDGQVIPNPASSLDPGNGRRIHSNLVGNRNFVTWYPKDDFLAGAAVMSGDVYDYFSGGSAIPLNGISLCTGQSSADNYDLAENYRVYNTSCGNNNSLRQLHGIFGQVPSEWDSLDGSTDGRANRTGYTNRYRQLVSGCTAPALDCVPFEAANMPVGIQFQYRDDGYQGSGLTNIAHPFDPGTPIGDVEEYDNSPAGARKILYPN